MVRPPPFRHCDTPTRTIRHCNNLSHKHLHIVSFRPHRARTVRPPPVRPLKMGLNVCCDNPTHGKYDPFSSLIKLRKELRTNLLKLKKFGRLAGMDSSDHDTQMALLKNVTVPLKRTSLTHVSVRCKPNLTQPQIWQDPPNRAPSKHRSMVSCWMGSTIPWLRIG
jgi:hypothetical protein